MGTTCRSEGDGRLFHPQDAAGASAKAATAAHLARAAGADADSAFCACGDGNAIKHLDVSRKAGGQRSKVAMDPPLRYEVTQPGSRSFQVQSNQMIPKTPS